MDKNPLLKKLASIEGQAESVKGEKFTSVLKDIRRVMKSALQKREKADDFSYEEMDFYADVMVRLIKTLGTMYRRLPQQADVLAKEIKTMHLLNQKSDDVQVLGALLDAYREIPASPKEIPGIIQAIAKTDHIEKHRYKTLKLIDDVFVPVMQRAEPSDNLQKNQEAFAQNVISFLEGLSLKGRRMEKSLILGLIDKTKQMKPNVENSVEEYLKDKESFKDRYTFPQAEVEIYKNGNVISQIGKDRVVQTSAGNLFFSQDKRGRH